PGHVAPQVVQAGQPGGWLALLLAVGVGGWYAGRTLAQAGLHVLCGLGLAAGVLAACTAATGDAGRWLSYHTLTASWALLGVVILAGTARTSGAAVGFRAAAWVGAVAA